MQRMKKMTIDYLASDDMDVDSIINYAEMSMERPSDFAYWGNEELFKTWGFAGIDYSRDATVMDDANYQAFHRDVVSAYPDDFSSERFNHWAVGWIERTLVRVLKNVEDGVVANNITDAFRYTMAVHMMLMDYPVLDDDLFSRLEWDKAIEFIELYAPLMIERKTYPDWSERLFSELIDMDVEVCIDAEVYPSEDQMCEAAYNCDLFDSGYEDEWFEFCWNNNLERPAIFKKSEVTGQRGFNF